MQCCICFIFLLFLLSSSSSRRRRRRRRRRRVRRRRRRRRMRRRSQTMDRVHETNDLKCDIPLPEPCRNNACSNYHLPADYVVWGHDTAYR
jgi:hypothetical protein